MNNRIIFTLLNIIIIWAFSSNSVTAGFQDIVKSAQKAFTASDSLSESEIIEGLKQALEIGSADAVELLSQKGGYYDNPAIKIPLPESVQKVEKFLRSTGFGPKVDAFELRRCSLIIEHRVKF